jgi:hypothetical protein
VIRQLVIVHYWLGSKSRDWLRHLLVPCTEFTIIAYVLIHMATPAKIAGISRLVVGAGMLLVSRRRSLIAPPKHTTSGSP